MKVPRPSTAGAVMRNVGIVVTSTLFAHRRRHIRATHKIAVVKIF